MYMCRRTRCLLAAAPRKTDLIIKPPTRLYPTQHIPYHMQFQDTVKPFFYSAVQEQQPDQQQRKSLRGARSGWAAMF